jgi:uncharacterized protein (DUF2249 family)/hemerythrin-like domain-containing protein
MHLEVPAELGGALSPDRARAVLAAFDAIAIGDTLVVTGAGDPQDLLELFQRERRGQFDWSGAAPAPAGFRTGIVRRDAEIGAMRRVSECLSAEHDRLSAAALGAFGAARDEAGAAALAAITDFRRALERHLRLEETVVLPVFEMRTGLPQGGPSSLVRAEHAQLLALLDGVADRLRRGEAAVDEVEAFEALMEDHHRKEEGILYPWLDRLLSEWEADRLVARLQTFPY